MLNLFRDDLDTYQTEPLKNLNVWGLSEAGEIKSPHSVQPISPYRYTFCPLGQAYITLFVGLRRASDLSALYEGIIYYDADHFLGPSYIGLLLG